MFLLQIRQRHWWNEALFRRWSEACVYLHSHGSSHLNVFLICWTNNKTQQPPAAAATTAARPFLLFANFNYVSLFGHKLFPNFSTIQFVSRFLDCNCVNQLVAFRTYCQKNKIYIHANQNKTKKLLNYRWDFKWIVQALLSKKNLPHWRHELCVTWFFFSKISLPIRLSFVVQSAKLATRYCWSENTGEKKRKPVPLWFLCENTSDLFRCWSRARSVPNHTLQNHCDQLFTPAALQRNFTG